MIAVIMAGGSGTRFWPRSREKEPKQFLPLLGPKSLLAETVERIESLIDPERVLIVTGEPFVEKARGEVPRVPAENVLGEPLGRNTAPCVALAAARVGVRWGDDAVMAVLPADHHIAEPERFLDALRAGEEFCRDEKALLTLGVRPTRPETGYGYLEIGEVLREVRGSPVHQVRRFVEKFGHAFCAGQRFLDSLPRSAQGTNRLIELTQIEEKGHQILQRQFLTQDQPAAKVDQSGGAQ